MPDDVNIRFRVDDRELDSATNKLRGLGPVGVEAGKTAGGGFSGMLTTISSVGFAIFGLQQTIGALSGAFSGLFSSNIQFEKFETSFKVLLGSTDAAKDRIAELSEFARATPFELPQVVQASQVLETFTKGALSTGDGLRLVGDVAASTGQPINELAMWFGRLYDGLQSGRPVGEAMMRLQEIGAVSGETRGKIEEMQKAGVDGTVVWDTFADSLGRFSGQMDEQSKTVGGALSNISDGLGILKRNLMAGAFEAAKPLVMGLANALGSRGLQAAVKDAGEAIGGLVAGGLKFMTDFLRPVTPIIGDLARDIGGAFLRGFQALGDILGNIADGFRGVLNPARDFDNMVKSWSLSTAFGAALGTLANGLKDFWDGLKSIADNTAVRSAFEHLVTAIGALIAAVGSQMAKDAIVVMEKLGDAFSALGSALSQSSTIQTIANILESLAGAIKKIADEHPDVVARGLEAIAAVFIAPALVGGITAVVGGFGGLAASILTFPIKMMKDILSPLESLKDKVFKPKVECGPETTACLDEVNEKIGKLQALAGAVTTIKYKISDVSETAALQSLIWLDKLKDVTTEIKYKLSQVGEGIKLPGAGGGAGEDIGQNISGGILSGLAKGLAQGAGAAIVTGLTIAAIAIGGTALAAIGIILAAALVAALIVAFPEQSGAIAGAIAGGIMVAIVGVPALIAVAGTNIGIAVVQSIISGVNASIGILQTIFVTLPGSLLGSFASAFSGAAAGVKTMIVGIITGDWGQAFSGALDTLKAIFVTLPMSIAGDFASAFGSITNTVTTFVSDVGSNFQTAGQHVLNFVEGVTGIDFSAMWEPLRNAFGEIFTFAENWFGTFAEGFTRWWGRVTGITSDEVSKIVGIIKSIPEQVGDATSWLQDMASQMMGGAVSVIQDSWSYIRDAIWSAKDAAIGALGDATNWLVDIGWAIMRGLANGIYAAYESTVGAALGWVTSKIPIDKGPVDVDEGLLRPVGEVIMGGLADGIKIGYVDTVRPALKNVTVSIGADWSEDWAELTQRNTMILRHFFDIISQNIADGKSMTVPELRSMFNDFMTVINTSGLSDNMKFQASAMIMAMIDGLNSGKGVLATAVIDFINFVLAQAGVNGNGTVGGGATVPVGSTDILAGPGVVKNGNLNPTYALQIGGETFIGSQAELDAYLKRRYPNGVPQDVYNQFMSQPTPTPTPIAPGGAVQVQIGTVNVGNAEEGYAIGSNIGYGLRQAQAAAGYG